MNFRKEDHTYWEGTPGYSRRYLGVTEVLRAAGLVDLTWATTDARDRGTYIHECIRLSHTDDLDLAAVAPGYAPYLEQWFAFLRDTGFAVTVWEHRACDPVYGYAGTLDLVGTIGESEWLIDVKTGTAPAWCALQTAAYRRLWKTPKRGCLELRPDGYRLIEHTARADERTFLAALAVAAWKEAHE